jgi:hypothetical protein
MSEELQTAIELIQKFKLSIVWYQGQWYCGTFSGHWMSDEENGRITLLSYDRCALHGDLADLGIGETITEAALRSAEKS